MERGQKQPQNYFKVKLWILEVPPKTLHGWIEWVLDKKQTNQPTNMMFI